MSFIQKIDQTSISIKLTNAGRERLANGNFNVRYYAIGDSEIDYNFYKRNNINPNNTNILIPTENITDIRYKIKKSFNDVNFLYEVSPSSYKDTVYNDINMGFFNGDDINLMKFNRESNRLKESGLKIDISTLTTNTNVVNIIQDDDYQTGNGVEVGDYILIGWTNPYTESFNTDQLNSEIYTPYIFYKIISISGTIGGNNLALTLDRNVPNFGTGVDVDTYYAYCFIYPKYDSILDYYGTEFLSDYWNFNTDNYIENCYNPNNKVYIWNYTLFYPDNYIGITDTDKIPNDLYSYKYKSFLNYISANSKQDVYGIIHYTNSLPDNNIGEGFYENTAELWIPTLMWHKNNSNKLGAKFVCEENVNNNIDLGLKFYNLVDENGNQVGKCFSELKIFLIEDQELVKVLAFKSNRNWTLPESQVGISSLEC